MKTLLKQTTAYRRIRAEAENNSLSHAALVVFPDEKLLRPLLKECAKAFFLAEEGSRTERLVEEEQFSDCLVLPEAGGKLTAELGGRIVDESAMRPVEGDRKLFVLDAFHTVTPLVQNKLLKVIEEPPEGVYFLLGATAEYAVLPTVLSRVTKFAEPPFAEELIRQALGRTHPGEAGAAEAAAACGGVYSVAENLLAGGGEEFRLAEEFLLTAEPEKFCRGLGEKQDKRLFFAALGQVVRDAAFERCGKHEFTARRSQGTARVAEKYPAGALLRAAELIRSAERDIGFNANLSQCALALAVAIAGEREKWNKLS